MKKIAVLAGVLMLAGCAGGQSEPTTDLYVAPTAPVTAPAPRQAPPVRTVRPAEPPQPDYYIPRAEQYVRDSLFDPDAGQFRDVSYGTMQTNDGTLHVVCGEVNGKNRYGAYVGYTTFVYQEDSTGREMQFLKDSESVSEAEMLVKVGEASCWRDS